MMIKPGAVALLAASMLYLLTIVLPSFGTAYGISGLIATALMVPGTLALKAYFTRPGEAGVATVGALLMLVGGVFINTLYFVSALAPCAIEAPMENRLIATSISLGNIFFLGLFLFMVAAARRKAVGSVITGIGVAGAVLVIPWCAFLLVPMALKGIGSLGFILSLVWMIAMAFRMLREAPAA